MQKLPYDIVISEKAFKRIFAYQMGSQASSKLKAQQQSKTHELIERFLQAKGLSADSSGLNAAEKKIPGDINPVVNDVKAFDNCGLGKAFKVFEPQETT